ncbi:LysR substrate-binding domain-containing protein [Desertihabitans aurantiacus]|uniref:LysR substrate-binding domain-containing protein n=1 Tax=Desertihabitans aurantiacus TaxID=2282477 RepID=UPI000DF765E7|nr:LysR substrate-binding domain-containing protein [Desertihabitans aurantiacus]
MRHVDELRVFLRLCDSLSFRRTSETEHVSASTLTRLVQRLERDAGEQLIERGPRGVAITQAGLSFAEFAATTVSAWEAHQSGQGPRPAMFGHIKMHTTPTAAALLVPDLIRVLVLRHPDLAIDLETGDAVSALPRILEGSSDIAIVPVPDHVPEGLAIKPLTTTPVVFAAIAELMEAPIARRRYLLPAAGLARERVNAWFRDLGVVPDIIAAPASHEAVLSLARAGRGVAALPELVITAAPSPHLVVEHPQTALPDLTIALCARQTTLARPAVAALWAQS